MPLTGQIKFNAFHKWQIAKNNAENVYFVYF